MRGAETLNPPIQYNWIWLLIGGILVLLIGIWYGFVFFHTRRRKLKSLDTLRILPPMDLNQLKMKYLQLIQQAYQRHIAGELDLRALHQELSRLVRAFVHEGNFLPAPFLTLSDLKLSPYPSLTKLIEAYYPEEFAVMSTGNAQAATEAAKGVVTQWPY